MWTKAEDKTWRRAQGAPGWVLGRRGPARVGCASLGLREAGGPGWGRRHVHPQLLKRA